MCFSRLNALFEYVQLHPKPHTEDCCGLSLPPSISWILPADFPILKRHYTKAESTVSGTFIPKESTTCLATFFKPLSLKVPLLHPSSLVLSAPYSTPMLHVALPHYPWLLHTLRVKVFHLKHFSMLLCASTHPFSCSWTFLLKDPAFLLHPAHIPLQVHLHGHWHTKKSV